MIGTGVPAPATPERPPDCRVQVVRIAGAITPGRGRSSMTCSRRGRRRRRFHRTGRRPLGRRHVHRHPRRRAGGPPGVAASQHPRELGRLQRRRLGRGRRPEIARRAGRGRVPLGRPGRPPASKVELAKAIEAGAIDTDHMHEIGKIAAGDRAARVDAGQLTLYKSVGVADQDAAAAGLIVEAAHARASAPRSTSEASRPRPSTSGEMPVARHRPARTRCPRAGPRARSGASRGRTR